MQYNDEVISEQKTRQLLFTSISVSSSKSWEVVTYHSQILLIQCLQVAVECHSSKTSSFLDFSTSEVVSLSACLPGSWSVPPYDYAVHDKNRGSRQCGVAGGNDLVDESSTIIHAALAVAPTLLAQVDEVVNHNLAQFLILIAKPIIVDVAISLHHNYLHWVLSKAAQCIVMVSYSRV